MQKHDVTLYFFSNAGEHGYAYAQALGSLAARSGFGFEHCCEGEPVVRYWDMIQSAPGRSVALSINESACRHSMHSVLLNEQLKKHNIPHVCFVIDHPLYVFADWMKDTHLSLLFTSPESEAFYQTHFLQDPRQSTDSIWNVGFHYGTSKAKEDLDFDAPRPHDLFVPVNFDWQGATLDSLKSAESDFDACLLQLLDDATDQFLEDGNLTPSSIAAFIESHGYDPRKKPFQKAVRHVDRRVALERRRMLLEELIQFPVTLAGRAIPEGVFDKCEARFVPYYTMMDSYRLYGACNAILNTSTSGTHLHDRVSNAMAAGCVCMTQNNEALKEIFPADSYIGYDYRPDSIRRALETVFSQRRSKAVAQKGWETINSQSNFDQLYGGLKRLVWKSLDR